MNETSPSNKRHNQRKPYPNRAQKVVASGLVLGVMAAGAGLNELGHAIANQNTTAQEAKSIQDAPHDNLVQAIDGLKKGQGNVYAFNQTTGLYRIPGEGSNAWNYGYPLVIRANDKTYWAYFKNGISQDVESLPSDMLAAEMAVSQNNLFEIPGSDAEAIKDKMLTEVHLNQDGHMVSTINGQVAEVGVSVQGS